MKYTIFLLLPLSGMFSCNTKPEISPAQKFEQVKEGMTFEEVRRIWGIEDTAGMSFLQESEVVTPQDSTARETEMFTVDNVPMLTLTVDPVHSFIFFNGILNYKVENDTALTRRLLEKSSVR